MCLNAWIELALIYWHCSLFVKNSIDAVTAMVFDTIIHLSAPAWRMNFQLGKKKY